MSILIKGMEMPQSCEDCHLESFCSLWVEARRICKWSPDNREASIRHPDCPLIELPPHGRLIDADALMKMCGMATDCYGCPNGERGWCKRSQDAANICEAIEDAPTIIPPEEEK